MSFIAMTANHLAALDAIADIDTAQLAEHIVAATTAWLYPSQLSAPPKCVEKGRFYVLDMEVPTGTAVSLALLQELQNLSPTRISAIVAARVGGRLHVGVRLWKPAVTPQMEHLRVLLPMGYSFGNDGVEGNTVPPTPPTSPTRLIATSAVSPTPPSPPSPTSPTSPTSQSPSPSPMHSLVATSPPPALSQRPPDTTISTAVASAATFAHAIGGVGEPARNTSLDAIAHVEQRAHAQALLVLARGMFTSSSRLRSWDWRVDESDVEGVGRGMAVLGFEFNALTIARVQLSLFGTAAPRHIVDVRVVTSSAEDRAGGLRVEVELSRVPIQSRRVYVRVVRRRPSSTQPRGRVATTHQRAGTKRRRTSA